MHIKRIELTNFRNYSSLSVDLAKNINLVYGNNAQGKTNFLESIYFAAFSKSFRTNRDRELIKYGENGLRVKLIFEAAGREQSIDISMDAFCKKRIILNGSPCTKIADLIGKINIATFFPEDLQLIKGSPIYRRRFLNKEISQLYPAHLSELMNYNKVMAQRNIAIKNYKSGYKGLDMIQIWDEQLAELGAKIIERRRFFIDYLNEYASEVNANICGKKERFILKYSGLLSSQKCEKYDKINRVLLDELKQNLSNDLRYGHTTKGPHKDDFDVYIDNRSVKIYGSQGQKRSSALAIKLAGIELITKLIKEKPIVILDDVFSELDINRRTALVSYISDSQTFISLTELDKYESSKGMISKLFVKNGSMELE